MEKLLPFQLNSILSNDILHPCISGSRRKAIANDTLYRLIQEHLGPQGVRKIISFRLFLVKLGLLSKRSNFDRFSLYSSQLKVSLAWLQRHLSICGGCGDADFLEESQRYKDYELVFTLAAYIFKLEGNQKGKFNLSWLGGYIHV